MRYSYEFKRKYVQMYREGKYPETPEGISEWRFHTQGEKAAIIKGLREKGYQLKYLLKAMGMPKSTYYYEIKK